MLVHILIGVEQSANAGTLWIYLTKLIKSNHPNFYYELINIGVFILPMFLSPVIARYADETRRIKVIIIIINFVAMSGSILYIIPWSPLFPFVGKLFNGAVTISRSLMTAEIARSYPSNKLQVKMACLIGSKAIGFSIGPCVVLPFAGVNIWLGALQIGYGNISGVILLILTILVQLCVICFAHDLSREYDMKEGSSNKHVYSSKDGLKALEKAFTSRLILLILFMSFSSGLCLAAFFRNFPVLVLDVLSMSYKTVGVALTVMGITVSLVYVASIKIKLRNVDVYWIGILYQISIIILAICEYICVHVHLSASNNIGMLVLYIASLCVLEIGQQFCLVVVFAKLVSSKHQSYLESIRIVLKQSGCIAGAFLCLVLLQHVNIFMPICVVVNLITLSLFYLYKDYIVTPVLLV